MMTILSGICLRTRAAAFALPALAMLSIASCRVDEILSPEDTDGRKVKLTISYQSLDREVMNTRSTATSEENKLNNLQVFVFDGNKDDYGNHKLVGWTYVDSGLKQDGSVGDVTVLTTTGVRRIYGVANTQGGTYNINDTSIPHNAEDAAKWSEAEIQAGESDFTEEEFKQILVNRTEGVINITEANFFMSGELNSGNAVKIVSSGGGNATIESLSGSTGSSFNLIKLYRIVAKIQMMITGGSGVEFTPTSCTICNTALSAPLITNAIKASSDAGDFEDLRNAIIDPKDSTDTNGKTWKTFSFYIPENRQNPNLTDGQSEAITEAADAAIAEGKSERAWLAREADTGDGEDAKEFTNAPQYATYLILRGTYIGPAKSKSSDEKIRGNTVYFLHLGEFNSKQGYTDFNVERNCLYTYHITITGVEGIEVEAKKEDLSGGQSGAVEGYAFDITSTASFYTVDSHYEQVNMKFYKSDFARTDWDGFYFKVDEPVLGNSPAYRIPLKNGKTGTGDGGYIKVGDKTVYQDDDGELHEYEEVPYMGISDDWTLIQVDSTSITSLPLTKLDGTRVSRLDEIMMLTGDNNFKWTEFTKGHNVKYKDIFKTGDDGELVKNTDTVFNVIDMLRKMAIAVLKMRQEGRLDDGNASTTDSFFDSDDGGSLGPYREYTCFISENYYDNYVYPAQYWGDFVDTDNRLLLIAKDMNVSTDERSLYADIFYGVEQYPIYTFYNKDNGTKAAVNAGNFVIGYGVETLRDDTRNSSQEDVTLSNYEAYTDTVKENHIGYGLLNQIEDLKINSITKWSQLDGYYSYAAFACMSRNRDLNGDDVIDIDEIRWYCPDMEQYAGLWIGEEAIPNKKARIFTGDITSVSESDWTHRNNAEHYYANRKGTSAKGQILWGEEGFAINIAGNSTYGSSGTEDYRHVRCARNLNPPQTDLAREYYRTYYDSDKGTYDQYMEYLRYDGYPSSWRDPYEGLDPISMYLKGYYTKFYEYNAGNRQIYMPYVDQDAIRTTYSTYELIPHTERGTTAYVNRPRQKFAIAKWNTAGQAAGSSSAEDAETLADSLVTTQDATTISDLATATTTICANYGEKGYTWRTPNERELALMYLAGQYSSHYNPEGCRTHYSNPDLRYSWCNVQDQHSMWTTPKACYVRCVRDVR